MTYYLHNNGVIREGIECPGEGLYCNPQPVAVIAYDDREQVERLLTAYLNGALGRRTPADAPIRTTGIDYLQAALREFANPTPPRPDEPLGLGAVVEDAEGERWVRSHPGRTPWTRPHLSGTYDYADISAVRILSEGVTP